MHAQITTHITGSSPFKIFPLRDRMLRSTRIVCRLLPVLTRRRFHCSQTVISEAPPTAKPHTSLRPLLPSSIFGGRRTVFTTRTMASAAAGTAAARRLQGKTVVITGASSGIGRSCALEFARTSPVDLRLVLTARRVDALKQLAADIKSEVGDGVKVLPVKLDVSKPQEVHGFVPGLPEEFRDIHVLVNNAGLVKGVAQAPNIAEEDIDIMFSTNVTGLINVTQAILPIFKARGSEGGSGDIINIGSIAGREPYQGGSIYCASKAAVRSFTESLRKELIATRIRVIGVDPGQVETEFSLVRFNGDKDKAKAVYAGVNPLTPDDIAEAVVFAATRRENVVIADTLVFPNHQAAATIMHRKQS